MHDDDYEWSNIMIMNKLIEEVNESLITEDWWADKSKEEQEEYIKDHPGSDKSIQKKKEKRKKLKKTTKNLPGIDKPIDKNSPKAKGATTKGPKSSDGAVGKAVFESSLLGNI